MAAISPDPAPWPLARAGAAAVLGVAVPLALLPWAGGLILLPYFLGAPAVIARLLAPRALTRDGYQILGVAVAAGGGVTAALWNVVTTAGDAPWPAVLAGGVGSFLLLSLVPVIVVILVSNRYPKTVGPETHAG